MDSAPSIQYEKIINTINPDINYTRNFEISSDKKNKYKISIFTKEDKLKITALNLNSTDIKSNEYGMYSTFSCSLSIFFSALIVFVFTSFLFFSSFISLLVLLLVTIFAFDFLLVIGCKK